MQETSIAAPQAAPQDAPVTDATPVTAPETTKPEIKQDDLAHRFAILSRKQKQIQQSAAALKAQEDEIKRYQQRQSLKKEDPIKYLQEEGLTLDQILERAAKGDDPPTTEDQVKKLQQKIEEMERKEQERLKNLEQQKEQEAVESFKKEVKLLVDSDPDKFETIRVEEAYEEVFNLIELYYRQTKEVLPIETAAQEVENYLFEKAQKLSKLKKLASQAEALKTNPTQEHSPTHARPTLNSTTTPEPTLPKTRRLSTEESIAEAAKLIRWTT